MRSIALLLVAVSLSFQALAKQSGSGNAQQGVPVQDATAGRSKSQTGKDGNNQKEGPCNTCHVIPETDEHPKTPSAARDPQCKDFQGAAVPCKESQDLQKGSKCDGSKEGMVIPCKDPKPVCKDSRGNSIPCKEDPPPKKDCAEGPQREGAVIPCTDQRVGSEKAGGFSDGKKRPAMPEKVE
jgi:hypothetical protein